MTSAKPNLPLDTPPARPAGDAPRRAQWTVPRVVALGVSLLLSMVLLLSVWRVDSTRVSLTAEVEVLSFASSAPAHTSELLLDSLVWSGVTSNVVLWNGRELGVDYIAVTGGAATVSPILVEEGTVVTIRNEGADDRYSVQFAGPIGRFDIVLAPGSLVALGYEPPVEVTGSSPVLRMQTEGRWSSFAGALRRRERVIESLEIERLEFWREGVSVAPPVLSTVRDGVLVLENVGGRRLELREGEPIALGTAQAVLRSVALEEGVIQVQADGSFSGIRSGYSSEARSLMPTQLERLLGLPPFRALLAVIAALIGSSIPFVRLQEK